MSTVVIYTSPARGHLYPMMDVAMALRARGHRVVVQTLAGERSRVEAAGVEHRAIGPAIEAIELHDHQGGNPIAQLRRTLDCWVARAPHEVADLRRVSEELAPDLLVVDANSWGAAAFAESLGSRWAMFLPYALPVPSPDAPAFGPGFAPPTNAAHRLRDRLVQAVQNTAAHGARNELNRLRSGLGVPGVGSVADVYTRADVLLYRTAEPFEYPRRDWPANVRPIGPGLWAPPGAEPDWLRDLPHPRRLVSVSTEYQNDGRIIETALAAFADQPGSVIATTSALDPGGFAALNENVRIEQFLPHAQIVPMVDVVITHGGMGTTQRALAAGVPVVVVPWGRDQSESARRAAHCGAGVVLPKSKLSPRRLRAADERARSCAERAGEIARAMAAAGQGERGADLLIEVLGSGPPVRGAVQS